MGMDTSNGGRKGKELFEVSSRETVSNSKSRKTRRRERRQPMIQTLFEICKEVFADGGPGFIPPPHDVERVRSLMDGLKAADVGLSPEMKYFRAITKKSSQKSVPVITYLHLYTCENFSMGIFCVPPSGVLPLHNHPKMTVFSKILFGTMHIKSYDWAISHDVIPPAGDAAPPPDGAVQMDGAQLAKLKVDSDFTAPCDTKILYPANGGNMHCFTAVAACAVLDVLGPPYSDPDGRHCSYYLEYPFDTYSADGVSVPDDQRGSYSWLREREKPDDVLVVGASYNGPMIVEF